MRSGHTLEGVLCVMGSAGVCQRFTQRLVLFVHLIYCALHKQQDIEESEQVLQAPQESCVGVVICGAQQNLSQVLSTREWQTRACQKQTCLRVATTGGNRNWTLRSAV